MIVYDHSLERIRPMQMEFKATSGNRCTLQTIIIGNRCATNATWDETPSDQDMDECAQFHTDELARRLKSNVIAASLHEENDTRRNLLFRKHLGGGSDN